MRVAFLVTGVAILVGFFGVSALDKMANTTAAVDALASVGIPETIAIPGAIVLTAAELLIAVALMVPMLRRGAAVVSVALLSAFAGGTLWMMWTGAAGRDCGCFGSKMGQHIGWPGAMQYAAFAGVGMIVILADRPKLGWDTR